MIVYAVQRFQTDTTKEGSKTTLSLYEDKKNAQVEVDSLNNLYRKDIYCTYRARIEIMEVK